MRKITNKRIFKAIINALKDRANVRKKKKASVFMEENLCRRKREFLRVRYGQAANENRFYEAKPRFRYRQKLNLHKRIRPCHRVYPSRKLMESSLESKRVNALQSTQIARQFDRKKNTNSNLKRTIKD